MKLYAVAGNPILHSKSPALFNAAFEHLSLQARYTRISASSCRDVLKITKELGLSGLNITAPFKETIIEHLDSVCEVSREIGAVNTIVYEEGELRGTNTDALGAVAALADNGVEVRGRKTVVLGAGGAGRAAAWGLAKAGAGDVVIVNRTLERAQRAAERLGCRSAGLDRLEMEIEDADIVVNCTPAGANALRGECLDSRMVVMDAVYKKSVIAAMAIEKGCRVVSGLDWLLRQAVAGFEWMTRHEAPEAVMRQALAATIDGVGRGEPANIAFVGFMASGKSTTGRTLAKSTGKTFEDLDETIEKRAGMTIRETFEQMGEDWFRNLEREVVAEVGNARDTIFACGGGAVLGQGNRKVITDHCRVIWLWAGPDETLARVNDDTRPVLEKGSDQRKMEALLRERIPLYARVADVVISTDVDSPQEIVKRLDEEIRFSS